MLDLCSEKTINSDSESSFIHAIWRLVSTFAMGKTAATFLATARELLTRVAVHPTHRRSLPHWELLASRRCHGFTVNAFSQILNNAGPHPHPWRVCSIDIPPLGRAHPSCLCLLFLDQLPDHFCSLTTHSLPQTMLY